MTRESKVAYAASPVFVAIGFSILACFSLLAPSDAYAQETHVVNCNCDTTDETQAQEAADVLAEGGDTVIMHNTQTGQSTIWNVTQQGTVTQGATQNLGPGFINYSAPTSSGYSVSLGSFFSSQSTAVVESVCYSAFPCESIVTGGT